MPRYPAGGRGPGLKRVRRSVGPVRIGGAKGRVAAPVRIAAFGASVSRGVGALGQGPGGGGGGLVRWIGGGLRARGEQGGCGMNDGAPVARKAMPSEKRTHGSEHWALCDTGCPAETPRGHIRSGGAMASQGIPLDGTGHKAQDKRGAAQTLRGWGTCALLRGASQRMISVARPCNSSEIRPLLCVCSAL